MPREMRFQEGLSYVSREPDLALTLENQEGSFRVAVGINTVLHVKCKAGHSISNITLAGQEVNWIIEKEQTPTDEPRNQRDREREREYSTSQRS